MEISSIVSFTTFGIVDDAYHYGDDKALMLSNIWKLCGPA